MIARGEKSHEYSMLRWLLLPTVFVFLQWSLLISPAAVLDLVPQLWETAPENASKALRLPLTRVQAFDLGVHAARYDECMRQNTSDTCTDHLVGGCSTRRHRIATTDSESADAVGASHQPQAGR